MNSNLKPLNTRPPEERKKIASAGGKASGEARRTKATMKDIANHFLSLPKHKGRKIDFDSIKNLEDIDSLNIDLKTLIILQQLKKASEGDLKSAQWIQYVIGETPELMINDEEEQTREASDFVLAIKERLDSMKIEGVDYEINEEGKQIPLKNGFPIPAPAEEEISQVEEIKERKNEK